MQSGLFIKADTGSDSIPGLSRVEPGPSYSGVYHIWDLISGASGGSPGPKHAA